MGRLPLNENVDVINGVQFSVMSGEEIRQRSVCEVKETNTFAGSDPCMFGLFDPRMGPSDKNKKCQTCNMGLDMCPGHFGHIELARPMFYIQFMNIVKEILHCVCFRCSRLLINKDSPELQRLLKKKISRQNRFKAVYKLHNINKKYNICGHGTGSGSGSGASKGEVNEHDNKGCGAVQPTKIVKNSFGYFTFEWSSTDGTTETQKEQMMGDDVFRILSRITDVDSEILGFPKHINRPENFICTAFPVPDRKSVV